MRTALGDPPLTASAMRKGSTPASQRVPGQGVTHAAEIGENVHSFCDGNTQPLENTRITDLALECWNLRKTIMEQSAQMLKCRKELKSSKNLTKNLQKVVSEVEAESLAKTKDITNKKMKIIQLEKKIHELTSTNTFINSSFTRNKRVTATLQDKVADLQRQIKDWKDK